MRRLLWWALGVFAAGATFIACGEDNPAPSSGWNVTYTAQAERWSDGITDLCFTSDRDGWACVDDTILHYDGSTWTAAHRLRDLRPSEAVFFAALAVTGPDNIWAIGKYYTTTGGGYKLYHWDGSRWDTYGAPLATTRRVYTLDRAPNGRVWVAADDGVYIFHNGDWNHSLAADITAFTLVDDNDAWACGGRFVYRWNGTAWSSEGFYPDPEYETQLKDIEFATPDLGWVVGFTLRRPETYVPVFMRYNGAKWETVPWPENHYAVTKCAVGADGAGWVKEDISGPWAKLWPFDGVTAPRTGYILERDTYDVNAVRVLPNGEAWASTTLNGPRVTRIWHFVPEN
jgi:hypothetical protein